jgi:hypothetical protein
MPVNNVGLLVYFSLGNKPLMAFVTGLWSLSAVLHTWATATSVPTASNRGNLSGPWAIGQILCALEFYISILNRVKVSKISVVSIDQRLHCIERGVLDSTLEPEGLEVIGKRRNPILLEVCMLVMLLNVNVLVKVEVLAVSLVLEGLQFGHNDAPG